MPQCRLARTLTEQLLSRCGSLVAGAERSVLRVDILGCDRSVVLLVFESSTGFAQQLLDASGDAPREQAAWLRDPHENHTVWRPICSKYAWAKRIKTA